MAKRSTISKARSANQQLVDEALQHGVFLSRYANDEAEKILDLIEKDVMPEYLGKLESALNGAKPRSWSAKRTRDVVLGLDGTLRGGLAGVEKKLTKDMQDLAVTEAEWQRLALKKATNIPIVDFRKPNPAMLRSIVTDKPFEGELMADWWKRTAANTQEKVARQINIGMAAGESGEQIAKRIRGAARGAPGFQQGTVDVLRRNSEAVTRTAVNHVSTHARQETLNENSDMMKGVRVVATLDGRTTPICQSLDGKIFKLNEGPRPPYHWNCRTTVIPLLKSAAELGLPFDESAVPPARRAALGGDVPETETYQTWLKRQPADFQDDVLGKARADLFRADRFTVQQFVDERGRRLTLNELRAKAGMDALPQKDPLGKVKPEKPFDPKLPNRKPPAPSAAPIKNDLEFVKDGERLPTYEVAGGKKSAATNEARERYTQRTGKLSGELKDALEEYAVDSFTEVNEHFRLGKTLNSRLQQHVDAISEAFKPSTEDLKLYRFSKPHSSLVNAEVGSTVKLKGFTSTSEGRLVTDHYQKNSIVMEILAPKGSKVLNIGNPDELEYLLAHNTEVEVVGHVEREFMDSYFDKTTKKIKVVQLRIKNDAVAGEVVDELGKGTKGIVPGGIKIVKDKGPDITKYNKSDLIHLAKAVKHYGVENGAEQLAILRKIGVPEDLLQRIIAGKPGVYDDLVTLLQKKVVGGEVVEVIEPIIDIEKKTIAEEVVVKDLKIVKDKGPEIAKYNKSDMIHLAKAIKHYGVEKASEQYNILIKLGVPEDLLKDVTSGKAGVYERLVAFRDAKLKGTLLDIKPSIVKPIKLAVEPPLPVTRPPIEDAPWMYSTREVREKLADVGSRTQLLAQQEQVLKQRSQLRTRVKILRNELEEAIKSISSSESAHFSSISKLRKALPPKYHAFLDEIEKLNQEYDALGKVREEVLEKILKSSEEGPERLKALLRIDPSKRAEVIKLNASASTLAKGPFAKGAAESEAWLNQYFGKDFKERFEKRLLDRTGKRKITVGELALGDRAHAYTQKGTIHLAPQDKPTVWIHEIAHQIDTHATLIDKRNGSEIPVVDLMHEFLDKRTQGEDYLNLKDLYPGHGYNDWEITRKDKFHHAYVGRKSSYAKIGGKEYKASEVLTMGLEEMYRDPIGFARTDPQYFELMLAVMRGDSVEEVRRVIYQAATP